MARLVKYVLTLGCCLAVVAVVSALIVATKVGSAAYLASAVAALTVWIAGSLALVVAGIVQDPQQRVSAILLGMLIRMGLPMIVGIGLGRPGGPLASGCVFGLIVVHYLVGLAIETPLLLRLLNREPNASSKVEAASLA